LGDDLFQLVYPVVAFNEDAVCGAGVAGDTGIPGKEDSVIVGGFSDELAILNLAEVERVEAEDSQPSGELAKLVIGEERRARFGVGMAGFWESFPWSHQFSTWRATV